MCSVWTFHKNGSQQLNGCRSGAAETSCIHDIHIITCQVWQLLVYLWRRINIHFIRCISGHLLSPTFSGLHSHGGNIFKLFYYIHQPVALYVSFFLSRVH